VPKSSMAMLTPIARRARRLTPLCRTFCMITLSVISSSSPEAAAASNDKACFTCSIKPPLRSCSADTLTAMRTAGRPEERQRA